LAVDRSDPSIASESYLQFQNILSVCVRCDILVNRFYASVEKETAEKDNNNKIITSVNIIYEGLYTQHT